MWTSAAAQTAPQERGFMTVGDPVPPGTFAVSLGQGAVRLNVPDGMTALAAEVAARPYPNATGPVYGYQMPDRSAYVAVVTFSTPPMPLNKLRAVVEHSLRERTADLRVIASEVIDVGDRRWVHLEITSPSRDGTLHQHVLVRPFKGGSLMVEMGTLDDRYADYRDVFLRTLQSVRVRE